MCAIVPHIKVYVVAHNLWCIQNSIIKWSVFIVLFSEESRSLVFFFIIIMWERCRKHVSGILQIGEVYYSFAGSMCPACVGNIPTH